MIERLVDMPAGTLGFRVAGEIEREDYEKVLVPSSTGRSRPGEGYGRCMVVEHLDEIEPGALWAEAKLGLDLGIRHHDAWVRSAIVTDLEWIARSVRLFAWMIRGMCACLR